MGLFEAFTAVLAGWLAPAVITGRVLTSALPCFLTFFSAALLLRPSCCGAQTKPGDTVCTFNSILRMFSRLVRPFPLNISPTRFSVPSLASPSVLLRAEPCNPSSLPAPRHSLSPQRLFSPDITPMRLRNQASIVTNNDEIISQEHPLNIKVEFTLDQFVELMARVAPQAKPDGIRAYQGLNLNWLKGEPQKMWVSLAIYLDTQLYPELQKIWHGKWREY